jgi:methyl-accepting chemotaxis protein
MRTKRGHSLREYGGAKMKMGPKLIGAFVVVSILSLAVGVTGYTQITSVNNELGDITTNKVTAMDTSMEMGIAVWGQRDAAAAYMLGEREAQADFDVFESEFDTFLTELRIVYPDTSEIDAVQTQHDIFCTLAEDPDTGLFAQIDTKDTAIAEAKNAMEEFDAAAAEMISSLEDLEVMQSTRKDSAQTNYADAVEAADASMEMKIALRQQQIAALEYMLGKDTYSDFLTNENRYDQEYTTLVGIMDTAEVQQSGQMHTNFVTFFYGGNLPYSVTLTMEDGTQETFTVGQIIVGVKPAYDNMIASEEAALQAMSDFDEVAAKLQTGNVQGIREDQPGGDDNKGLDGLEEYALDIGDFGEIAMDAMIVINKIRDAASEYLREQNPINLTNLQQDFESWAVEFDTILWSMDVLAEKIDGPTVNNPLNTLLWEVRDVRDKYGQFLDWATDGTITGLTYTPVGTSHPGMFEQHYTELEKRTEYGQKMEDTDAAGTALFAKIDTNATLSANASLRDIIWEQIMAVNDYVITGDPAEKTAFTNLGNQIAALPYYSEFQTEHQAVLTEGSATIAAYDAYVVARANVQLGMEQFDILGLQIEYGDTDYQYIDTTYNGEGSTDPSSITDPIVVGDNIGLDYLEWRGDVYREVQITSLFLSYWLKVQQDAAAEYLLEEDISNLSVVESEFLASAETFYDYLQDLSTFSGWMSDDTVLFTLASENSLEHGNFLDMAVDIDWGWTAADETDPADDGMFTAHYNDLVGDWQMMDQLEDFKAMADEIADVLDNLEASVKTTMIDAESELNLAFEAADGAMELKTLLVQQMDTAAEYLLEDNITSLPAIENEFKSKVNEFDALVTNLSTLVDDGNAGLNQEEALVALVGVNHDRFLDYATDDPTLDVDQLYNGMLEAHDAELAAIDDADQQMVALDNQGESLKSALDDIEGTSAQQMADAKASADDAVATATTLIFAIAAIAVILGILLGLFISRGITKPVTKLVDSSKAIAEGDFGVELEIKTRDDEIGEMAAAYQDMLANTSVPLRELNSAAKAMASGDLTQEITTEAKGEMNEILIAFAEMQGNLRGLVKEIQVTSNRVASTSQELASSAEEMNASTQQVSSAIQQMSQGSQSQAAQVEDTAKVMKEMSDSVNEVTSRSQSAAESTSKMTENAESGRKAVEEAVMKMREIQNVVNDSATTIGSLGKRSEEIGQIVDVITNITDQTNLLALNAAIEAARAAEQGRGFAVVAEEVKNLAEDSREAADRIAVMIKEIQQETGKAVEGMQRGTNEVEEGLQAVNSTDEAFQEIFSGATSSAEEVQAISASTQQQMAGTERVAKSIDTIASVAEESASAAEESASSTEELTASMEDMTARAQELSEMALNLQRSSGRFKIEADVDAWTQQTTPNEATSVQDEFSEKTVAPPEMPEKVAESLSKRGLEEANEEV